MCSFYLTPAVISSDMYNANVETHIEKRYIRKTNMTTHNRGGRINHRAGKCRHALPRPSLARDATPGIQVARQKNGIPNNGVCSPDYHWSLTQAESLLSARVGLLAWALSSR